jgi:translation initiation factor 2 alpha subunit (eIF-2alpha)
MDGFAKTKLSLLLESQEEEFRVYDDMKTTKEIFRSHVEKFVEGFMSFEDLKGHGHQLLETLGNKTAKEKMAKIFDSMVSPEEINKITSTLNKRQYRGFQASTQGFQVFSGKVDN